MVGKKSPALATRYLQGLDDARRKTPIELVFFFSEYGAPSFAPADATSYTQGFGRSKKAMADKKASAGQAAGMTIKGRRSGPQLDEAL